MEKQTPLYTSFSDEESASSDHLLSPTASPRRASSFSAKPSATHRRYLICSYLLNLLLILIIAFHYKSSLWDFTRPTSTSLYTPVQHLLTPFHARRMTTSFGRDATIYQGPPSEEKEAHWQALYVEAVTIPRSEARRLHNKTVPIHSTSDTEYIVGLNVFHYLHCLHFISNALDFFHYPATSGLNATNNPYDGVHTLADYEDHDSHGMLDPEHLGHCVDTIRQALMCHADTTPFVWQHDSADNKTNLYQETMHMCTDFSALRQWAGERRFDGREYEEDFEYEAWRVQGAEGGCGYEEECGEEGLPVKGDGQWRKENEWRDSERWLAMDEKLGKGEGEGNRTSHHGPSSSRAWIGI